MEKSEASTSPPLSATHAPPLPNAALPRTAGRRIPLPPTIPAQRVRRTQRRPGSGRPWLRLGIDKREGEAAMCDLVARTGRHLQRYESGRRLVAGCIPFRICDDEQKKFVEVLMISSQSGPGLLFPKGGWENDETVEEAAAREAIEEAGVRGDLVQLLGFYDFKSKKLQDEFSPEGMCRAAVFALLVKEELASWPEQRTRQRQWLTVPEAAEQSRHPWVQEALVTGFSVWLENWSNGVGCPDQSKR